MYNDILATADFWGFIKFHHIGTAQPVLISEENRYHEGGFSHLDHDGDKLISVSVNEFVAWDFITGEKFCILGTAKSEQSPLRYFGIIIKGPIVYFIEGRSPSTHKRRFCI